MNLLRKIITVNIEGIGDVRLRKLSAGAARRIAALRESDEGQAAQGFSIMAELIASCLIDEAGRPVYANAQQVLDEMELEPFTAIGNKALEVVGVAAPNVEDAAKNLSAGPTDFSATGLPADSGGQM